MLQSGAIWWGMVQSDSGGGVWNSLEHLDVVQYDLVQCVWHSKQSGAVWWGMVRSDAVSWDCRVWCSVEGNGKVWCSVVSYGTVWCSVIGYGKVWCSRVGNGKVWCSVVRLVRSGVVLWGW